MNDTTNIIRKESINFQISGNADGMVLQQEITGWCRDVLNPSVDFVLKEYEQIDETIFIDNINLDISLEKIEIWKEGLAEKIIHQLKEKIQSKITSGKNEVNEAIAVV